MGQYSVYKVELAVASQTVGVNAGGTVTSNIASKEAVRRILSLSPNQYEERSLFCRLLRTFGKLGISTVLPVDSLMPSKLSHKM